MVFPGSQVDCSQVYTDFRDQRIRLWIVGINATAFKGKIATPAPGVSLATSAKKSQKICETCVFFEEKGWGNFIRNMKTKTVCAELQIAFSDLKNVFCRNKESKANFLTKEMGLN